MNQPIFARGYAMAPTTTFTIWTPYTGNKVVLTDIIASSSASGTVRILGGYAGGADPAVLVEFIMKGSTVIHLSLETPILVPQTDGIVRAVSGMNGFLGVTLIGTEFN